MKKILNVIFLSAILGFIGVYDVFELNAEPLLRNPSQQQDQYENETDNTVNAFKDSGAERDDTEAHIWRKLYSNPQIARNLREDHSCDSCWGQCLQSAGVANCCNDAICIGLCDYGNCSPSQMTAPLSLIVIGCSLKCI